MVSVIAATGLVAAKLAAGFLTHSLALYSEAGHSAVDLLAAFVSLAAVIGAARPPDREHQFGHAKYESLGALVELTFLLGLGVAIVYNAILRLMHGGPEIQVTPTAMLLIALTISVDLWRTLKLHAAAKHTGSEALAASAMHFLSDFLGTLAVVGGLIFNALGFVKADSIAALVIGGMVSTLTFRMGRNVISSLTDKAPVGVAHDVEVVVHSVEDVIDVHDIRVRQAGSQYFTEMHVNLAPQISLERAHDVLDEIEHELHKRYPKMHVTTHPEPWEEADPNCPHER
jgi:cation diffusion facilitator family transporter